jgi:hypothetical protein
MKPRRSLSGTMSVVALITRGVSAAAAACLAMNRRSGSAH